MSISMHAITAPVFQTMLTNLDFVLARGAEFTAETGLDEGEFMERRLAPDMLKLAEQVRQACVHATGAMARLAGVDAPEVSMEADTDIAGARARIAAALAFVGGFSPAQLDGDPDREVIVKTRLGELQFTALDHVLHIAYPQVFFHVTTAYNLLRAEGVQIGKVDFLGAPMKNLLKDK
jgi:hypothetical protein